MPELSQALMAILQLQPKGDLVKRESEKLEEVKSCTLTVIAEFPKIPDIRECVLFLSFFVFFFHNLKTWRMDGC